MIILALDVATSTGWAVYDPSTHQSAIQCGVLDRAALPKEITGAERRRLMRRAIDDRLCALFDRFRPDFVCIEQPLNYIKAGAPSRAKPVRGQPGMFQKPNPETDDKGGGGGPNADTVLMLNQIFAVADTVCAHKARTVIEVAPKSWQVITKQFAGDTKERSIAFCRSVGIVIPPELNKKERGDAADACVIAIWAAGHSQELKMMQRARQAA